MANILLVEDNEKWAEGFKWMLECYKHNVTHAWNGKNALDTIDSLMQSGNGGHGLNLIFTDYNMPLSNGYEFCKAIRTDPKYSQLSDVPIIGIGDFPNEHKQYLSECRSKLGMEMKEMIALVELYSKK